MPQPRIVICYWADVELSFVRRSQQHCDAGCVDWALYRIKHHPSWFTQRRSLFRNFMHLGISFARIVVSSIGSNVCVFGTNACRAMFPFSWLFRRTLFVYNELPEHRQGSPLRWLDQLVFKHMPFVYVSTEPRASFVRQLYRLERQVKVVENIAFEALPKPVEEPRRDQAVFAGSITPKRFSPKDIDKFLSLQRFLGSRIVIYGTVARELSAEFAAVLEHRGNVSHDELMSRLPTFKYALLAYYQGEPNYELCAPLKLYEYVAAGCTAISINRNQGLLAVAGRYPNLLTFADDIASGKWTRDEPAFLAERDAFLGEARRTNEQLVKDLVS